MGQPQRGSRGSLGGWQEAQGREMGGAGPWVVLPAEDQGKASPPTLGSLHLLEGPCKWDVPTLPAFFASKIVIRNKRRAHSILKKKKKTKRESFPTRKRKILIKRYQFIRLLDTACIACNFSSFKVSSEGSHSLLPPPRPRVPGRAGKRTNLQQFLKICL